MSDAKFVAMLVIFTIAFFVMLSRTWTEAAVLAALLAWGLWNDYRYGRLEKRFAKYKRAYNDRLSELIEESDRYDDRYKYKEQAASARFESERAREALRSEQADDQRYRERSADPDGAGSSEDRTNIKMHRGRAA